METQEEQNLLFHLKALRQVLLKCLTALAFGLIPMFGLAPFSLKAFISFLTQNTALTLNYFTPMEVFILELKLAALLDVAICFPYLARQIWLFVAPALYENERRLALRLIASGSFLFMFGLGFGLFGMMPLLMRFGLSFGYSTLQPMFGVGNIISLSLHISFIFGLMFQFPLITFALIKNGILTAQAVKNKRPYMVVTILVLSALLTPPDIISQLMLFVPTYALFEAGLFFATRKAS